MNRRWGIFFKLACFILLGASLALNTGCHRDKSPLIVYAGKGIKSAMEEIQRTFEDRHKIPLSIIYAGSNSLLTTIKKSNKGDIFIPGSASYINEIPEQVTTSYHVANHIPVFIVRADNTKQLQSFTDLMQKGLEIAVGNKDMCAIGKVAETIISASDQKAVLRQNIVITASTVNELLSLVINREVDAALVWGDMLQWPEAAELQLVAIPEAINSPKEIRVAILKHTSNAKQAALFAEFVATEGKVIFANQGFRVR